MKTHTLWITVLLILALLVMSTPVAAAQREPVGDRINLHFGSTDFPAGEPFYIQHGWMQPSTDDAIGVFDFELEVDGVLVQDEFKIFSVVGGDPDMLLRLWLYNFPDGMTGEHTFTGHWLAPCQYAVDELGYAGPCVTPNAKVESNSRTVVVTFVP